MEIAQEKLLSDFNLEGAKKVITESLIGFPDDLAMDVITGKKILLVDDQNVVLTEYLPGIHDVLIPQVNLQQWYERIRRDLVHRAQGLCDGMAMNASKLKSIRIEFKISEWLRFVNGTEEVRDEILNDKRYDYEALDYALTVIDVCKNLLIKWAKFHTLANKLDRLGLIGDVDSPDIIARLQAEYTELISSAHLKR
jgi:hypothetical protein